jgi:SPP1 family predicted phage head-tail adaptor
MTGAGDYRDRITLHRPGNTMHPETGEQLATWAEAAEVWAKLVPLSSREAVRAKAAQVETTHRVIIRYRPDVQTSWRITWDDPRGHHAADIAGIVETVRRHELELQCVEVSGGR